MGNPGIIYGRTTIDFGASGVQNAQPGLEFVGSRTLGGTAQTTLFQLRDRITIEKTWTEATVADLYRKLLSWWAYAAAGGTFAFALDLAKTGWAPITSDPGTGNSVSGGDFEAWLAGASAPDKWTLAQVGSTTFSRESQLEHVWDGLFSLRWNIVSGAQSTAMIQTPGIVTSFTPLTVSYRHKSDVNASVQAAVKDVVGNLWWTGSAWSGSQTWITPTAPTNPQFALASISIAGGQGNDGAMQVWLRNPTTGTKAWVDDVRLEQANAFVSTGGAGFAVNDQVELISRSTRRREAMKVQSVSTQSDGSQLVFFVNQPAERYDPRDIIQHQDYYPFLTVDQRDPAVWEELNGVYRLKAECVEILTGRN